MQARRQAVAVALAMCAVGGASVFTAVPQPPGGQAARAPRNAEEFDALFQQVKNWGRCIKAEGRLEWTS